MLAQGLHPPFDAMRALLLLFALLLLALAASGCGPSYVEGRYVTTVSTEPPAPYVEVVSPAPTPKHVWVDGYWWWDGRRYVWVRGHWVRPPRAGYVWVRGGWVVHGGSYRFVHGRWLPPARAERYRYVHPPPRVRVKSGARYRTAPPSHRRRDTGRSRTPVDVDVD